MSRITLVRIRALIFFSFPFLKNYFQETEKLRAENVFLKEMKKSF